MRASQYHPKKLFIVAVATAALYLVILVAACTLLYCLGPLFSMLGGEAGALLGKVFSQLTTAVFRPPLLLSLLFCLLFGLLLYRFCCKRRLWLWIPLMLLTLLLGIVLTALFTRVNGIRFLDVVMSLLKTVEDGLLTSL